MRKYKFNKRSKIKGSIKKSVDVYLDEDERAALTEFAAEQTKLNGFTVSPGTIMKTAAEHRYPEIRQIYKNKKGKRDAKTNTGKKNTQKQGR